MRASGGAAALQAAVRKAHPPVEAEAEREGLTIPKYNWAAPEGKVSTTPALNHESARRTAPQNHESARRTAAAHALACARVEHAPRLWACISR
eukprot:3849439-Prymnesium_polylepis.1